MAYCTIDHVKSLNKHLFNQSNPPTNPEVQLWINEGAAIIDAELTSAGYSVPVATSAAGYEVFRNLNYYYAAAMCEQSRLVSRGSPEKKTRGEELEDWFWKRLDKVMARDLTSMGVSHTSSIYVGGISLDDKEAVEGDSDRIMTFARRGMHAYPGAGTTAARTPSDPQERSD